LISFLLVTPVADFVYRAAEGHHDWPDHLMHARCVVRD
jgi:hypothetical protein